MRAVFLIPIVFTISACSYAETLHDKRPPNVELDLENPTWENGISQLVSERCASCHQAKLTRFVPTQTPLLDFTKKSFFDSVKNRSLNRIQEIGEVMPPLYADPLLDSEKQALIKYLQALP